MPASKNTDDTAAVLEKIAKMPEPFRSMSASVHKLILDTVPGIKPRVWYGMPGYALSKSSPVVCYFRADKYFTFGLTEKANFNFNGNAPKGMSPTAWFLTELTPDIKEKITEVLKNGIG